MGYIVIENFKFGLDSRRDVLTSKPGTLVNLENAHIDQGGQVEKRKAFIKYDLPTDGGLQTYGLEATKDGLVVFGFAALGGSEVFPPNVSYKRLVNSVPGFGVNPSTANVSFSTIYGNKTFAIKNDDATCFYDGAVIRDFTDGIITQAGYSNPTVAQLIWFTWINGISGNPYLGVGRAFPNDNLFDIYGPPGTTYTVAITNTSAAGTLASALVDTGIPGIPATKATGSFQVIAGSESGGNQITQIAVGATNLLTAAVPYNDSVEQTASDLSVAINANSGTSGYTAVANQRAVNVFSVATGTSVNNKAITVTAAGDVCIGQCSFAFVGTGFTLNSIKANGTELLTGAMVFPTPAGQTLSAFVGTVKTAINGGSGTHGYTSFADGPILYLSKLITSSSDSDIAVAVDITPTPGSSGGSSGTSTTPLIAAVTATSLPFTLLYSYANGREGYITRADVAGPVTVLPANGVPPYTYNWVQTFASFSSPALSVSAPTSPTTSFRVNRISSNQEGTIFPHVAWRYKCIVTDSVGVSVDSPEVAMTI